MSQHSSCWLARHQFFIKYCVTEKETFKGEEKIEFAVSTQALMILAFYKVINWLCEGKKQVVLHTALQIEFSLLFYLFIFFFLKHLDFPHSLRHCTYGKKNDLAICMTKSIPLCLPFCLNKCQFWQPTGHNSILWNLNTTMHFMVAKGKKVKDKIQKIQKNLSRPIF